MRVSTEIIQKAIADEKIKVVSFDVFDTLLLRPFFKPTDLFYYLDCEATDLLCAEDVIRFSEYRKDAESRARIRATARGEEDVTLQEIYDILEDDDILPQDVVSTLQEKELELEKRFCYARKSAKELAEYAVTAGKRIVAISDMYLPVDFLEELLKKNGMPAFEHIFVSSEAKLSKRTGHLYQYALEALGIRREQLIHIGDNLVSDIEVPGKMGIKAFPLYRTIDLISGKYPKVCGGKAFRYAFEQIRSPFPNLHALDTLGVRCMVAVAANRIYDDPYRNFNKSGDYAGDELLFGNFALGLYSMAQALWVEKLSCEDEYDNIAFFSRDGYLPYRGFYLIQKLKGKENKANYVRISRKATLPLLLSSEERLAFAGSYVDFKTHSPKSLTNLLSSVLKREVTVEISRQMGSAWEEGFTSEVEMMRFLYSLYHNYVVKEKMEEVIAGFRRYFTPYMSGNVLTCDVGYSLRNEMTLHSFFPEVKITTAYIHTTGDLPLKRSRLANIQLKRLYYSSPYVSWLPRELFMTENAPSCIGYTLSGEEIMEKAEEPNKLLIRVQEQAISYMEEFVSIFREGLFWLPVEPADACLPMEAFLHSPTVEDRKWIESLETDNSFGAGLRNFEVQEFWKNLCSQYWAASCHFGKTQRKIANFALYLFTDHARLRKAISKRLPNVRRTK